MTKGITARLLPTRHGASPVNHCITSFRRVQLPQSALLGQLAKSDDAHLDFLNAIWRIGVGTLALSSTAVPYLQVASTVAFRYSLRRTIIGTHQQKTPILSFPTQELPVYTAVAQSYVLEALSRHTVKHFMDHKLDPRARHGCATVLKAAMMSHSQTSHYALSERCGAQGLFGHNQIIQQLAELRGMGIAEGDTLVLSIRLASELILERYALPAPADPTHPLARHEAALFAEQRQIGKKLGHRSTAFAGLVLNRCAGLVEAIAHRMCYEAAVAERVPQTLIDLYVVQCMKSDLAWYVETGMLSRARMVEMERDVIEAARPKMEAWVEGMGVGDYVRAPMCTDHGWEEFVAGLPAYGPRQEIMEQVPVQLEDQRIQAHL